MSQSIQSRIANVLNPREAAARHAMMAEKKENVVQKVEAMVSKCAAEWDLETYMKCVAYLYSVNQKTGIFDNNEILTFMKRMEPA